MTSQITFYLSQVIGNKIYNANGERIGRIKDLLVDMAYNSLMPAEPGRPHVVALKTKISASSLALEKVYFIKDCPVFSSSDPRFGYDIVLAVGKRNQLSDGVKYQVFTSRDYLPEMF